MKTLFLILLGVMTGAALQAQCTVDSVLRANYDRDVKDLALRRINLFHHADTASIEIPGNWQDTIWSALAAIFNETSLPERDTVFNIYCIHHVSPFDNSIYRGILVGLVDQGSWTEDPATGEIHTGDAQLDDFLHTYGWIFDSYFSSGVFIEATRPINVPAFIDSLYSYNGITYIEPNYLFGDGNRIYYHTEGESSFFDFSLRWGDCPAGCISGRTWHFEVRPGCEVKYLGFSDDQGGGEPIPPPVNCNIANGIRNNINNNLQARIFPNPAQETLNIEWMENAEWCELQCFSLTGALLYQQVFSGKTTIDVQAIPAGIYFIHLRKSNGDTGVYKWVKN